MKIKLTPDRDIAVQNIRIGKIKALVLRPANRPTCDVAALWIHGGGYFLGMKEMVYMSRAMDLVRNFGVTVFSPGYRLALWKPYPAAVDDCFETLRYMDDHRESLGIRSIVVGGESAGGGLAAAVCMMARNRGIKVAYQLPLYPMLSNTDTESSGDNHGRIWNTRRNHIGWRLYLRRSASKAVSPYASAARQTDYTGLPPCYTFVGDGEPFYSETLDYVEKLKAAGVDAAADVFSTDIHAFDMLCPDLDISRQAIKRFNEQFRHALENYLN